MVIIRHCRRGILYNCPGEYTSLLSYIVHKYRFITLRAILQYYTHLRLLDLQSLHARLGREPRHVDLNAGLTCELFSQTQAPQEILYADRRGGFKDRPMDNLEELISCIVCCEDFDEELRVPKGLPCMHTICLVCASKILDQSKHAGVLECPECRRRHVVPNREAGKLPTNVTVMRLMSVQVQATTLKRQSEMRQTLESNIQVLQDCVSEWNAKLKEAQEHCDRAKMDGRVATEAVDREIEKLIKSLKQQRKWLHMEIGLMVKRQVDEITGPLEINIVKAGEVQTRASALVSQDQIGVEEFKASISEQQELMENPPTYKMPKENRLIAVFDSQIPLAEISEFGTLKLVADQEHLDSDHPGEANHRFGSTASPLKQRTHASHLEQRLHPQQRIQSYPAQVTDACKPLETHTLYYQQKATAPVMAAQAQFPGPMATSISTRNVEPKRTFESTLDKSCSQFVLAVGPTDLIAIVGLEVQMSRLKVLQLSGIPLSCFRAPNGHMQDFYDINGVPLDIAIDKEGNMILLQSDYPSNHIICLDKYGMPQASLSTEVSCSNLAIDIRGFIHTIKISYVLNEARIVLSAFDFRGREVKPKLEVECSIVGAKKRAPNSSPLSSLAVTDGKYIFTSSDEIFVISDRGEHIATMDIKPHRSKLSKPAPLRSGIRKVTVSHDRIIVVDDVDDAIHTFNFQGQHIGRIGGLHHPTSVALTSKGNIVAANAGDNKIYVY